MGLVQSSRASIAPGVPFDFELVRESLLSYTPEEATRLGQVWKDPPTRAPEGVVRWWKRDEKKPPSNEGGF